MTGETIFHGSMGKLLIFKGGADILMTAEAQLRSPLMQNALEVRGMWIMTLRALPLHDDPMSTACTFRDHRTMAMGADSSLRRRKETAVIRSMGIVAPCALSPLYGGVDERLLELVREIKVAFETEFPPRTRFQFKIALCGTCP